MHLDLSHATKINGITFILIGIIMLLRHLLKCSADSEPEYSSTLQSLPHQKCTICSLFTKFFHIPSLSSAVSCILSMYISSGPTRSVYVLVCK